LGRGGRSAKDCHDRHLPENGCQALPTRVFLELLALGECPRGHKIFHDGAVLQLMFDGVRMVQTCHFEKLLKIVLRVPHLAFEVMLDGRDVLLIGVVRFLVIAVVADSDCDPSSGVPLLPLFVTIGTFPSALDGGFGRCYSAAASGHFHIAQNEGSPNRLLTKGVLGGNIKQLLGGIRLIMSGLMHQGTARCARPKHRDDISVGHPKELMTLPREASNVILEGFACFLLATLHIPGVARLHIRALEVDSENLHEILLVVDDVSQ
jgi:hypothetical protein